MTLRGHRNRLAIDGLAAPTYYRVCLGLASMHRFLPWQRDFTVDTRHFCQELTAEPLVWVPINWLALRQVYYQECHPGFPVAIDRCVAG